MKKITFAKFCIDSEHYRDDQGKRRIPSFTWDEVRELYNFPRRPPAGYYSGQSRQHSLRPSELQLVICLLDNIQPERVLEIGVNEGFLASVLLNRFSSIRNYIGVDVPNSHSIQEFTANSPEEEKLRGQLAMHDARFALLLAVGGTESLSPSILPRSVDVCIVDADHRRSGVERDTRLARAAAEYGIIFWHDYDLAHSGVKTFLDKECQCGCDIASFGSMAWEVRK